MVGYLANAFVVKAAGCIGGLRTESSIVTSGRILGIIEVVVVTIIICCSVLLETEICKYHEGIMG